MTEPESQTEDETVASDFLGEVTSGTEGVTSDGQISLKYKSTKDETNEHTKKKRPWMDRGSTSGMKS